MRLPGECGCLKGNPGPGGCQEDQPHLQPPSVLCLTAPAGSSTPKRWVWVSGFIHNTHRDHALGPCTGDLEPHSDQNQDPNAPRPLAAQAADPCSSLHLCTTQQNRGSGCQNHRNKSSSRWQGTRTPANSPQLPSAKRSDRAPLPAPRQLRGHAHSKRTPHTHRLFSSNNFRHPALEHL